MGVAPSRRDWPWPRRARRGWPKSPHVKLGAIPDSPCGCSGGPGMEQDRHEDWSPAVNGQIGFVTRTTLGRQTVARLPSSPDTTWRWSTRSSSQWPDACQARPNRVRSVSTCLRARNGPRTTDEEVGNARSLRAPQPQPRPRAPRRCRPWRRHLLVIAPGEPAEIGDRPAGHGDGELRPSLK